MQTPNAKVHGTDNDPEWQFLAEYPLSEFLADHYKRDELTAGLLYQTLRELGMRIDYLENIDLTLKGFAKEALANFEQGSMELSGRIRVFCQKKIVDDANSEKTSRLYEAHQAMEQAQIVHPSGTIMNIGWGCFLIKRGGNDSTDSSLSSHHLVDLYLYKEG